MAGAIIKRYVSSMHAIETTESIAETDNISMLAQNVEFANSEFLSS